MKLEYLDIPYVYCNTEAGAMFIYALKESDDLSLFARKSVQIMIDEHHQYWSSRIFWGTGFPMIIQLVAFWYWSNIVIINLDENSDAFVHQDTVCKVILVGTSFYLLFLELTAMWRRRLDYFEGSSFKVVAIVVPTLLMMNVLNEKVEDPAFWTI